MEKRAPKFAAYQKIIQEKSVEAKTERVREN